MPQLHLNALPFALGRRARARLALARARHDVHALDAADVTVTRRPAADGGVEREVLDGNPSVQVVAVELPCARIDHDGVHPFAVKRRTRLSLEGVNKQSVSALAREIVLGCGGGRRRRRRRTEGARRADGIARRSSATNEHCH